MITIRPAQFPEDRAVLIDIWREYVSVPKVDLAYQGYETEFADLPGKYAAPGGNVLLAIQQDMVVGCIAMRKIDDTICEMKRLYVRPKALGVGLGRKLIARLIAQARDVGYAEMRLDVLPEFAAARHLYESFGFKPAAPVSFNPVPGTAFLGLVL
jgi:putative acetyltransferase